MFNLYSILQSIFLIAGLVLLLFGLRFFKFFLYCTGISLSFMASEFIYPLIMKLYPLNYEQYTFLLLGLGIILGFLFHKTYTLSIYLACILTLFFILQYYAQIFNVYHFQTILFIATLAGTLLNYFFKRSITILITAALGAIFFTTSLSLLWQIQENGINWLQVQESANLLFQQGIKPSTFYQYLSTFKSVNFFSYLPLALTFLSCLIQNFITCKKVKA